MTVTSMLDGQKFTALNGGPHFKFTPAISFLVDCKTQKEVDDLWRKRCYRTRMQINRKA
jgi:predicted 3-demethylubiquinone-9 3-methyltransferase (glyoxalase superfamily)